MELFNPYFYAADINLLAYENAWTQYIKSNEKNTNVMTSEIYDSWDRCKEYGLNPLSEEKPVLVEKDELEKRLKDNKYILKVVQPFISILFDIINKSEFIVVLSDREGIVLQVMSDHQMDETCKKMNLYPGADRREHKVGTHSINMVINQKKPVQLTGCQHYKEIFHHYASSSSPVCRETGELLCILGIVGKYELANEHTLGMVYAITKAIENQHSINSINQNLAKKNNQMETILSMINDSVIYSENQQIIQVNNSMLTLIGKPKNEIIGKNTYDVIITQPPLEEILSDTEESSNSKPVLLVGESDSYKCIVSCEKVNEDPENNYGKIIRFTPVKTIEMMVSKIQFAAKYSFHDLIGASKSFLTAISAAKKAAQFDSRVIITGESGTGKEMFAQAIHNSSSRKNGPFIAVDCGAIPYELFESEFFGYEKGAFTGANREGKMGLVEKSNDGTLFLDEIGNLSLDMQIKLLRALQEGVIYRVGGEAPIKVDFRAIAATNANLEEEIKTGAFREDLYYRLNVFSIKIPPLRERKTDIPLLINNQIKRNNTINSNIIVDKATMNLFINYDWPGNVRQLNNAVERAIIMSDGNIIRCEDISDEISKYKSTITTMGNGIFSIEDETLESMIDKYIKFTVDVNNGNISKSAKKLGVSRSTIYNYLSKETDLIKK